MDLTKRTNLRLLSPLLVALLLVAPSAEAFGVSAFTSRTTASKPSWVLKKHEEVSEVVWQEEDDEYDDDEDDDRPVLLQQPAKGKSRWDKLNTRIKERIVQEGQDKAVANKKKRESPQDKKRRMMMFVKEKQQEKKQSSRIERVIPLDKRTPLAALIPGMNMTGTVISLTSFGAYVDVGTECDGLLHVSQMSNEFFVEHPKQVVTPGESVTVAVRSFNAVKKKLHLTMLPGAVWQAELEQAEVTEDEDDRIPLDDIFVDDELWGVLRRVTDYGAYVQVGAVVDGWLHFMDHPAFGWSQGSHPSSFMATGDRVRVWVSDVDHTQGRIKLTANRPSHLPGPRRDVGFY